MSAVLAVLMVCVGLGVAVQDAMPGDPLWGVSKALNSERAASIEGTAQTRRYLDVAHTELLLGHRRPPLPHSPPPNSRLRRCGQTTTSASYKPGNAS